MFKQKQNCVDIGGQAVMEGVMMKGPEATGIAVRRSNGNIVVSYQKNPPKLEKHKWMELPFIRGIVNFVKMMVLGMSVLEKSTNMLGIMDEEPSKFELWLSKKLGKSIEKVIMGLALILALLLSVFLFMMIPEALATYIRKFTSNRIIIDLSSGLLRIIILIIYISLVALVPDVRRTFIYHGAEHKTVYCHENNLPLTPENADTFSRLHPRCGTSFLLIVFIISILMFTAIGYHGTNYILRLGSRLLLMPIVAGISYEVLKALAHNNSKIAKALRWPGLKLQLLTTREPDKQMLECAIVAMNTALHGLPEGEVNEDGYTIIKDYRISDPELKILVKDKAESLDNENI